MKPARYFEKTDPGSSHDLLRSWLRECRPGLRVLDIGTAGGTLGKMAADKGLEIYGVEPDPDLAELARPHYQDLFIGKLEEAPDDFLSSFDVVVCADVLEHLPDPQVQLMRVVRLQKAGTLFLVCVPNIANVWIRLQLLSGKFEYADRGILDRTHLRFFTYTTFIHLLSGCSLDSIRILPTPIPAGLVAPEFFSTWIGRTLQYILRRLTLFLPRLLGYQFFASCRKSGLG